MEAAVLEESVGQGDGHVGLARPSRHLHEAAVEALLAQARLDAVDRGDLRRPQRTPVECGKVRDPAPPRRMCLVPALQDAREGGRLRDVEDPPCPRGRVVPVGEVRLGAAGLEHERQPPVGRQRREPHLGGQTVGVHRGLPLDAGERRPLGLGLDDADRLLVDVEQVVDAAVPGPHDHLPDRDALGGEQVQRRLVLHGPSGLRQLPVDQHPSALLRLQAVGVVRLSHGPRLTAGSRRISGPGGA